MKRFLCFLLLIFMNFSFSQKFESLKKELIHKSGREKIETYLNISKQNISRDTIINYLNKAIVLAKEIHFDSVYPIQFNLAVSYYLKGDYNAAKKEIRKGYNTYKYTTEPEATFSHISMLLGVFNESLNEIDSARYYYKKSIDKLRNNTSKKGNSIRSTTFTNLANLDLKQGNYKKAIQVYLEAAEINNSIGDDNNQMITLNNIASSYKEINELDKALNYYQQALKIASKINEIQYVGSINIGIGEIYMLKQELDNGLSYFLKAEKDLKKTGFNRVLNIAYQNIAQCYLQKNDLKKAKTFSNKALKGVNLIEDPFTKVSVFVTNSNILEKDKEYKKALKRVDKAISLSRKNSYQKLLKDCIEQKIRLLKITGDLNRTIPLYEELLVVKDSILNKEKFKTISSLETKYQTELKEKENQQLKAENSLKALKIVDVNKQKKILIFSVIISLLVLGVFSYFYRKNNKQKNTIENLQKDLHHRVKNNLTIIDSLIVDIKEKFKNIDFQIQLSDLQNRIKSMNEIHRQLYENTDISNLKLKKYITKLVNNIQLTFSNTNVQIFNNINKTIQLKVEDSFPIGLIVNEFITNSYKHAFGNTKQGVIKIGMKDEDRNYRLTLSDNGCGLPENFEVKNLDSFGFEVMDLLSKQLGGKFYLKKSKGVEIQIIFPKK